MIITQLKSLSLKSQTQTDHLEELKIKSDRCMN